MDIRIFERASDVKRVEGTLDVIPSAFLLNKNLEITNRRALLQSNSDTLGRLSNQIQ